MWYDCGDSFPFNFEPNGTPFCSKSQGKPSPRSYPIRFERNWKYNFLSVPSQTCGRKYIHYAEKLASLGIMGDKLGARLKPLNAVEG